MRKSDWRKKNILESMDNYCLILIQYLQVHKYIIRYFLVQSKGPKASAAEKLIENILQYMYQQIKQCMYVMMWHFFPMRLLLIVDFHAIVSCKFVLHSSTITCRIVCRYQPKKNTDMINYNLFHLMLCDTTNFSTYLFGHFYTIWKAERDGCTMM